MSQHRLWKIFDQISMNPNIPGELTKAVYGTMTDFTRSKLTEEQAVQQLRDILNRMRAGANYYYQLLSSHEEE